MSEERLRAAICICTCRRPEILDGLLSRLESVVRDAWEIAEVTLVVVDDCPSATARSIVDSHRQAFSDRVEYVVTGSGNIATARNRAVREGLAHADFLAFTDDDCLPLSDWLRRLLEVQQRYDADIVSGHFRDLAPNGAPRWFTEEPWIAELGAREEGELISIGPLKSSLVRAEAIVETNLQFDEEFGRSGGEDALFFRHAAARGLQHRHAPAAVVEEPVPLERATTRYQFRRALWYGNSEARTSIAGDGASRVRLAASSVKRVLSGPSYSISRLAHRQTPQWRWSIAVTLTGIGRLLGSAGVCLLHSTLSDPTRRIGVRQFRRMVGGSR